MMDACVRTGTATLLVLALTSFHHAYGTVIYETPWRLHVMYVAVPVAVLIVGGLVFGWVHQGSQRGCVVTWVALAAIVIFPISIIGLYEGAYNHLLKNILYVSGPAALVDRLFPAPTYVMPNDLLFEASGIAQFLAALLAAKTTWHLARGRS